MAVEKDSRRAVRLQVPVRRRVAVELESMAKRLDQSVAWFGRKTIEQMLTHDVAQFAKWISSRVTQRSMTHVKNGEGEDQETTRLQITVWEETAKELDFMADRLNQTSVKLAALVIEFGLEEYSGILKFWTTTPFRRVIDLLPQRPQSDPETDAADVREL